jgi:hypothetical protein
LSGIALFASRRESKTDLNETHSSLLVALAGGGAGSNAVTRIISWREIARSNQKRGKQADEHGENQRRKYEQPFVDLTNRGKFANCERRYGSPSESLSGKNLGPEKFYEQTERQIEDRQRDSAQSG